MRRARHNPSRMIPAARRLAALTALLISVTLLLLAAGCRLGAAPQPQRSPEGRQIPGPVIPLRPNPSGSGADGAGSEPFAPATPAPAAPGPGAPIAPGQPASLAGGSEKMRRAPEDMDISQLYPGMVFRFGNRNRHQVAITFDDGPDAYFTPQILDALKEAGAKATFFLVGNRTAQFPEIAKRIVDEGHAVGNHTYSHARLTHLDADKVAAELEQTRAVIRQTTGQDSRIFRPPYGAESPAVLQQVFSLGYKVVLWDVDSLDWKGLPADQVIDNVLNHAHPGAIILHHSAGGKGEDLSGTVQALPAIVSRLHDKGYQIVTLPEMLGLGNGGQQAGSR